MKKGDKLFCHTNLIMMSSTKISLKKGKFYTIIYLSDYEFSVIDDENSQHFFHMDQKSHAYYGKWFSNLKDERKRKLTKLNKIN